LSNNVVFVNVYAIEQRYGGSEEGGWYYTCGIPVVSKATTCVDSKSEYDHGNLCPAGHWKALLRDKYNNKAEYVDTYTHDANGVNYLDTMDVPTEFAGELVTSGSYEIRLEDHPGEVYPTHRPHYE
jgi:hypothetical protein